MKSGSLAGRLGRVSRVRPVFSIVTGAVVALAIPVFAQVALTPPSSGLINPRAIVFSPKTGKVYVVDTGHNAVQIYNDATRQSHRVQVGAAPVSIAVNTANGAVYVANAGDGTVTVIDGNTDAVTATVPIGSHPYSIAVDSAANMIYATHTFGNQLSILDGSTNAVSELKTGSSDLIAINSRTGTIYLLGYGGAVKVLDTATRKLIERPVGKHAWGLTLNDATGVVYVTRIETGDLAALSATSANPVTLDAGAIPCAIAVNSKSNTLYVANYGDNSVSVIDANTGHSIATVHVDSHPKAVAFDPKRNLIYTANTSDGSVTVINAANYAVLATLPAGKSPYAIAVVPGSGKLYVANEAQDNASTVVDLSRFDKPAS